MVRQIIAALIGVWLMAAPAVLGYGAPAADVDRIVGPLVVSFALIALWEVTRATRWVNVGLAAGLLAAPVVLRYGLAAAVNSVLCGLMIGLASWQRGHIERQFGGGWRALVVRPKT